MFRLFHWLLLGPLLLAAPSALGQERLTPEQTEYFESRIRPVLVRHCYECHNSAGTAEGGLVVDHRTALRKGGDSGPAIDMDAPDASLLLKALRHESDVVEMPQGSPKLSPRIIADIEKWVAMGAPDPRDAPPTPDELARITAWETLREKRKEWWSFQPIESPPAPEIADNAWSDHPVDRFLLARLREAGLAPTERADRATLIRRATYVLTGLPPSVEEVEQFVHDESPDAWERLIDRLLDSRQFGEHWARHWMDWMRYAESHGSEGDPVIPHAWRYRDYLIRALNDDVPVDRLLREHVAGDLLTDPRINAELGINESAIGPAHWRMVFHGFAPTDALDEKVRFTDDQINVFSKAFLGLTVSCARCHHHKFDAVSQEDFYALFGIFGSTRPGLIDVNTPERQQRHRDRLTQLKQELRPLLAEFWLQATEGLAERLLSNDFRPRIDKADKPGDLLHPLHKLRNVPVADRSEAIQRQGEQWRGQQRHLTELRLQTDGRRWNLADAETVTAWHASGNGLPGKPAAAGEFTLSFTGEAAVAEILPAGVYSHLLSTKHRGVLGSPRVRLDEEYDVWLHVAGEDQALLRYVVQNYPRSGTVYPVRELKGGEWRWEKFDLAYWNGDEIHLELTTAADSPVLAKNNDRSWFGIREALIVRKGAAAPPREIGELFGPLLDLLGDGMDDSSQMTLEQFAQCYEQALRQTLLDWREGRISDGQALFLDACLKQNLLSNRIDALAVPGRKLIEEYRRLEAEIPLPTRVPGVWEADHFDQPLFVRGEHTQPAEPVARRFLEAIDATPYQTDHSGRLQLADDLVRADNPLVARVAVNRIWQALFGEGLVRTPDNFGRMGEEPTHPELLDHLASRFRDGGWSTKRLIRELLLSGAWQLDSQPSALARQADPDNRLLSHAPVRRLPAESLRDTLLGISGQLDPRLYGPPAGPETGHRRRSVYMTVHRNTLNPFLETFDSPVPFATKGRRDSTNVPAQSLTLLNDPFVIDCAAKWADRVGSISEGDPQQRISLMFRQALGRPVSSMEATQALEFVQHLQSEYERHRRQRESGRQQLARLERDVEELLAPVRRRLLDDANRFQNATAPPRPVAAWDFSKGLSDQVGALHGTAHGGARIEDGALLLDGRGHVSTPPIPWTLRARTLEAWVQLTPLDQRGGGVVTLQTLNGDVFDSIVIGERQPRKWIAGSDYFRRTNDFNGPEEDEAARRPVHVAAVYDADGTIRFYRDGRLYGTPYRTAPPVNFAANQSQVLFGLRHGQPTGNRLLAGRIIRARLYDRPLTAEEIAASASGEAMILSERDLVAALLPDENRRFHEHRAAITSAKEALEALGPSPAEDQPWIDLAHAIFNLKEFLYLR